MILEEIYKHNRRLSQRRPTELLTFDPPENFEKVEPIDGPCQEEAQNEPRNWRTAVGELINRFRKETTIHGINHVCSSELGWKRRSLWFIAFTTALLTAIYVMMVLAARFNRKQFETVIETTDYPAVKIAFPEVVICNKNRLNWKRLEEAQGIYLSEQHQTSEMRQYFAQIVGLFDNMTFGEFSLFEMLPAEPVLKQLNYINFTNVVDFMSWRCNELFSHCKWREIDYDCCDIFTSRRSQLGQCLSFNNVEGEEGKRMLRSDPKWPWRNGKSGSGSGLMLKVLLDDNLNFPNNSKDTGITVMMVEPFAYNDLTWNIYPNNKAQFAVNSILHFYDKYTYNLHPKERECIFEGEQIKYGYRTLFGHKYMYENCQAECQQLYLLYYCNCTVDLMFPPANYRICKLVDLPCLAKYNDRVQHIHEPEEKLYINLNISGITCKCFYNCYSLTYVPEIRIVDLEEQKDADKTKGLIDLEVFFKQYFALVYRTSLVFTWVDLLVSFGGIAGLFLGCSLMSIVELVVFFFIGIPQCVLHHHQQMKQQKNVNQKLKEVDHSGLKQSSVLKV